MRREQGACVPGHHGSPHGRMRANPANSAARAIFVAGLDPPTRQRLARRGRPWRIGQNSHRRRLTKLRQGAVQFIPRQKARTDKGGEGRFSCGPTPRRREHRRAGEGARRDGHRLSPEFRSAASRPRSNPAGSSGSLAGRPIIECSSSSEYISPVMIGGEAIDRGRLSWRSILDACRESKPARPERQSRAQVFLRHAGHRPRLGSGSQNRPGHNMCVAAVSDINRDHRTGDFRRDRRDKPHKGP